MTTPRTTNADYEDVEARLREEAENLTNARYFVGRHDKLEQTFEWQAADALADMRRQRDDLLMWKEAATAELLRSDETEAQLTEARAEVERLMRGQAHKTCLLMIETIETERDEANKSAISLAAKVDALEEDVDAYEAQLTEARAANEHLQKLYHVSLCTAASYREEVERLTHERSHDNVLRNPS